MGEGWGSGCRIQQCPGTETGGRGLPAQHRAEGLGGNVGMRLGRGPRLDMGLRHWYCKGSSELSARWA